QRPPLSLADRRAGASPFAGCVPRRLSGDRRPDRSDARAGAEGRRRPPGALFRCDRSARAAARPRGTRSGSDLPGLDARVRLRPVPLGVPALHRVRTARARREAVGSGAENAPETFRAHLPRAGRCAAQLHPPRLPEPEHHGARGRRAGGDRLPGRAARAAAVRPRRAAARQLRRAGPAADRRHAGAVSGAVRGRGRAAGRREGLRRFLRSADGAAQAQGRGPLRLHRSGEEEPVLPGAHPELAEVRSRRAEAASRATRGARDPREARPGAAMRSIAVVPFAVDGIEPEAHDLAQWLAGETAWELCGPGIEARLVIDPVALSPEALGDAAAQLGVEAALGATFALAAERLTLHLLLAEARGNVRAQWDELAPLGIGPHLGRRIARRVLHALGEDAAAPPESIEREAPGAVVLRLA